MACDFINRITFIISIIGGLCIISCACDCSKSNSLKSNENNKVVHHTIPTPSIVFTLQPPQHLYLVNNLDPLLLPCRVHDNGTFVRSATSRRRTGSTIVSYVWRRHGRRSLPSTWRLKEGHLTARVVRKRHSGRYVCYASNDMGTVRSFTSNLHVVDTPIQRAKRTVCNSRVRTAIQCTTYLGMAVSVRWYRNNTLMSNTKDRRHLPSGTLILEQCDDAYYHCEVTYKHTTYKSVEVHAKVDTVNDARGNNGFIVRPISKRFVDIDSTFNVECVASMGGVKWHYRENNNTGDIALKRPPDSNGGISFANFTRTDIGYYTCINEHNTTASIYLSDIPQVFSLANNNIIMTIRSESIIELINDSNTKHNILSWYQNGKLIVNDGYPCAQMIYNYSLHGGTGPSPVNGTLVISPNKLNIIITDSDKELARLTGFYQVRSELKDGNGLIYESMFIKLLFYKEIVKPRANLVDFQLISISSSSINVTWQECTFVMLYVRSVSRPKSIQLTIPYGNLTSSRHRVIGDLLPFTEYEVAIESYTTSNMGSRTRFYRVQTLSEVPMTPAYVDARQVGLTSLYVFWHPLTLVQSRGKVINYRIEYTLLERNQWRYIYVDKDTRKYLLNDLNRNSYYRIRISAETAKGYNNTFDIERSRVVSTGKLIVYNKPSIQINLINSSAIDVEWHHNDYRGSSMILPLGYELSVYHQGALYLYLKFPSYVEYTVLSGLESNKQYKIQINGYNEESRGLSASRVITTYAVTSDHLIQPPRHLTLKSVSANSMNATWMPPLSNTDALVTSVPVKHNNSTTTTSATVATGDHAKHILYMLRYREANVDGGETKDWKHAISKTDSLVITHLKAYTIYEFSVRSRDDGGKSIYSKVVPCQTDQSIPSEPQNINIDITRTSNNLARVELRWNQPNKTNGLLTAYFIKTYMKSKTLTYVQHKTSTSPPIPRLVINNLALNADYVVDISALTVMGPGKGYLLRFNTSSLPEILVDPLPEPKPVNNNNMNSYFILGIGLICVVISAIAVFIFVKRLRENKAQTSDILRQQRRDMHELTSFLQTEASNDAIYTTGNKLSRYKQTTTSENLVPVKICTISDLN